MVSKCGHCRRKQAQKVMVVKAKDGSKLNACYCGKTWVKPAPKPIQPSLLDDVA